MRATDDWDKVVFIDKLVKLFLANQKKIELGEHESACLSPDDLIQLVNKDQKEEIELRLHGKCLVDKTKHMLLIFDFFLRFLCTLPEGMPKLLGDFATYIKAPP